MPTESSLTNNNGLIQKKPRNFLVKEYDDFYRDLIEYTQTYFPTKLKAIGENSAGGALLEFVARVADVHSFYLDHQFHEISPTLAVELKNIERHLTDAGVPITGAAPAVASQLFVVFVPTLVGSNPPVPDPSGLLTIRAGTKVLANGTIKFELVEDLDFSKTDPNTGDYKATVEIGEVDESGNVISFKVSQSGLVVSGDTSTESFDISSTFSAFQTFTLSKENVTSILSVVDNLGNTYYEVGHLTQNVVYRPTVNRNILDKEAVPYSLEIVPCPYRFTRSMGLQTRLTTLTFGGGNALSTDNDNIPDPSEFALPLYGKPTFSRFTINPSNLLNTSTLGAVIPNTTLTITYRYGGGLSHNVGPNAINSFYDLITTFPTPATDSIKTFVLNNVSTTNPVAASGGDDPPSINQLRDVIPVYKSAQSRDVTHSDLLATIYKMPPEFGRVYRACVKPNPNNPLSSKLFVVCRNADNELAHASDSLKLNLQKYLNEYRVVPDALDILDVMIINLQLQYSVVVTPTIPNKQLVIQTVNNRLKEYLNRKLFQIDEPIMIDELRMVIYNSPNVLSVQNLLIKNATGRVSDTVSYSNIYFDVSSNTYKNILFGPEGSIFEFKYKDLDIQGTYV